MSKMEKAVKRKKPKKKTEILEMKSIITEGIQRQI